MKIREKDFLGAMPRETEQRYFDMVNRRIARTRSEAAARKGRHLMKKIGKLAIGIAVTAAVLTAGGIAAIVAMRGHNGGTHYDRSDVDSILQSKSESSAAENAQSISLNLTEQYWYPAMQTSELGNDYFYTQSDSGWYHSCRISLQASDGDPNTDAFGRAVYDYDEKHPNQIANADKPIYYLDSATGEDVILCAKPDCLHDGNEYCEATTTAYTHGNLLWHEGVLYAAAQKHNGKDEAVLLSYDPTGTGITELASFGVQYATPINHILIHRGYVWCMFRITEGDVSGVDMFSDRDTAKHTPVGYVIMGYEIATGQTVELYRAMRQTNLIDDGSELPEQFTACGDYLFYRIEGGKWPCVNYKGIFSVNLKTGEHKKVTGVGYTTYERIYTATEDSVVWCQGDGVLSPRTYVKTNFITGEQTDFYDGWFSMLTYDGERFYGLQQFIENDIPHNEVVVLGKDGKELGRWREEDSRGITGMQVQGDTLYLLKYGIMHPYNSEQAGTETIEVISTMPWDGVLIACKTDDLIAGSPQFEEILKVTNRIILDVEPFR